MSATVAHMQSLATALRRLPGEVQGELAPLLRNLCRAFREEVRAAREAAEAAERRMRAAQAQAQAATARAIAAERQEAETQAEVRRLRYNRDLQREDLYHSYNLHSAALREKLAVERELEATQGMLAEALRENEGLRRRLHGAQVRLAARVQRRFFRLPGALSRLASSVRRGWVGWRWGWTAQGCHRLLPV